VIEMRLIESLVAGVIMAILVPVLAHHWKLHLDLFGLALVSFLVMFVVVLVQPRSPSYRVRGRR
jgi:hypothetical protein